MHRKGISGIPAGLSPPESVPPSYTKRKRSKSVNKLKDIHVRGRLETEPHRIFLRGA